MIKRFAYSAAALTCLILFTSSFSLAQSIPFSTPNQSPLIAVYGLPSVDGAKIAAKHEGAVNLTLDLASNYVTNDNSRETIVLDGESLCLTIAARYGIGRNLELGIDVPMWVAGGGFLDGFIEGYHSTFGFPNGGRELAPRNRLLYDYRKDGQTLLHLERSGQGLGDIRFTGGWQVYSSTDQNRQVALRAALKLPTGDTDALFGSGSVDLALWLMGGTDHHFALGKLSLFGAGGLMGLTRGKVLPDQQRSLVGFGTLGLGFQPTGWLELKIQTNAHTSFYSDSDLTQINAPSAQLTMGGALHFSPQTSLAIGVTEDVVVGASPDVVFHLSLQHRF